MKEMTMTNYMVVKQKVEDLKTFKKAFDGLQKKRREAGLIDVGQFHAADEPNTVIVIMQTEDLNKARQYWHSEVLAHGREQAHVVGPIEINPDHVWLTDGQV